MTRGARVALAGSLVLAWANFLLTGRWAAIDGALHGWRKPWVIATLAGLTVAAAAAFRAKRGPSPVIGPLAARLVLAAGAAVLVGAFLWWFPPGSWSQLAFSDNWPPRFQSTRQGVALLRQGALTGWEWQFLGGYHTSSDITQSLTVPAFLPMTLFGDVRGFHLLQFLLFLAPPAILYLDLHRERPREWAPVATGLACLVVASFSYTITRSGDTNSIAGLTCTALVVAASHAARRGTRWGWPVLVAAATLAVYSHAGFAAYAALFVLLDAVLARDVKTLARGAAAFGIAAVVSLPSTWELLRYPDYFNFNNVVYEPGSPIYGPSVVRRIAQNVQLLVSPGRWLNDYTGLTAVFLPVIAYVAWRERGSRVGFYAAAVLLAELMLRFNIPQFGYVFSRPIHLLVFLTPPVLAWVIVRSAGTRSLALALIAFVAVYIQITFPRVPHVASIREFDPALVERVERADGALVLVENSPHRDMDADPLTATAPTPFVAHFEPLLAAETGRRLYAGFWDGWQWCPWRGQTLAAGAIFGRRLSTLPYGEFRREMARWGVRRLLVWSDEAVRYLRGAPGFQQTWSSGRWHEFVFGEADAREVVTESGTARLLDRSPLRATVKLEHALAGARVRILTNYHPAWTAAHAGRTVELFSDAGQLAFAAPADGTYDVTLAYPRRVGLSLVAVLVFMTAIVWPIRAPRAVGSART